MCAIASGLTAIGKLRQNQVTSQLPTTQARLTFELHSCSEKAERRSQSASGNFLAGWHFRPLSISLARLPIVWMGARRGQALVLGELHQVGVQVIGYFSEAGTRLLI